eukprot:maker-scaffold_33-snap-gene-2.6-mRNA-1 protein AED:0.00 eAED:0.00 QI:10/1/1/1/1/1/2/32/327
MPILNGSPTQYTVGINFTDSISSLCFSALSPKLLSISSWSKKTFLYNTETNSLLSQITNRAPILCSTFSEEKLFSANLDGTVSEFDLQTSTLTAENILAENPHNLGVSSISYNHQSKLLITGSWDKSMRYYDIRQQSCIATVTLDSKIFGIDTLNEDVLTVGSGEKVYWLDLRILQSGREIKRDNHEEVRCPVEYQCRSVEIIRNGKFAVGSIEGRVGIGSFKGEDPFSWKCHRKDGKIYPVHGLSHLGEGIVASCGGDGKVIVWNVEKKKKIKTVLDSNREVCDVVFSRDKKRMAIAVSNVVEEEKEKPYVIVKEISEGEFDVKKK